MSRQSTWTGRARSSWVFMLLMKLNSFQQPVLILLECFPGSLFSADFGLVLSLGDQSSDVFNVSWIRCKTRMTHPPSPIVIWGRNSWVGVVLFYPLILIIHPLVICPVCCRWDLEALGGSGYSFPRSIIRRRLIYVLLSKGNLNSDCVLWSLLAADSLTGLGPGFLHFGDDYNRAQYALYCWRDMMEEIFAPVSLRTPLNW